MINKTLFIFFLNAKIKN